MSSPPPTDLIGVSLEAVRGISRRASLRNDGQELDRWSNERDEVGGQRA